jgi:hypothetical protein
MFIDDASNATGKFLQWLHQPPTAQAVTDMLTHDAQTWERLLWTSGGLLNLTKCLYYVTFWTFDVEGRGALTPKDELPQLILTNGNSAIDVVGIGIAKNNGSVIGSKLDVVHST